jgi:FkbM family methyltransferase
MHDAVLIVLILAIPALAVALAVQGKRLAALRRRARRSMLIGPESHLRLQKQLYDHIAAADCRLRDFTPRLSLEFRSEWGEDTLLYDLFRGQDSGTYIEVGALDGRRNSVTWVFEALGWAGLLVEAIPERAAECRACRPGSFVIHAALGPPGASGKTSFVVPLDEEHQLSGYREHEGMQTEHVKALERAGARTRRVDVDLITMDEALIRAGFDRVDFASIDVEGGELDVLRGFDLERFRPRVLMIEDLTLGEDDSVPSHLRSNGYEHALWIGANRVYIRRDDDEMAEKVRRAAETVYSPFVRPHGQTDSAPIELK